MEIAESEHRRAQEEKRNEQRLLHERIMFYAIVGTLAGTLLIALAVVLLADNDNRQEWAQSIVVLILGGVVGGMAGYITGQASK